jgi:hypothetical protein
LNHFTVPCAITCLLLCFRLIRGTFSRVIHESSPQEANFAPGKEGVREADRSVAFWQGCVSLA